MSEKEQGDQRGGNKTEKAAGERGRSAKKPVPQSRDERLADALRANLRRRKSAAKSRGED